MTEDNLLNLPEYYRKECPMRCGKFAYPYKIEIHPKFKVPCAYYTCESRHTEWVLPVKLIEMQKDES